MRPTGITRREFSRTSMAGAISASCLAAARGGVSSGGSPPAPHEGNEPPPPARTVIRADMSRCQPASALSRTFETDRWQLIQYETEDDVKGFMASAYPEHQCGELTLPLNAEGLYKVYLGINYTKSPYREWSSHGQLDVKLTGDAGFRRVAAEAGSVMEDGQSKLADSQRLYKAVQEAYWRTAELTGKALVFRQPQAPYNGPEDAHISNLAYVKLVPLDERAKRRWKEAQPREETRRLALIYCTAALTGSTDGTRTFHPTTEQWFEDELAAYANSDIKLFIFEAMRGNFCLYRTKIGDVGTADNRWRDDWIDPLAAFTRLAHRHGMKIFASMRMIGPQYPMIRAPIARARHYWRDSQWTKRDRNGVPVSNLSIAFPEVRKFWLSLLREALGYGIDGIQLHLNRSTPFVLYEQPVVLSFQEKHGEDPRKLPSNDPRWLAHAAVYLTEFVREVRALVNEKPGRQLGVTVFGPGRASETEPQLKLKSYVCDVETWLREELVDYVMPSKFIDLDILKKWRGIGGPRAHLWPDLMPRAQPAQMYAKLAKKYYDAGADGLCLWDGERRHPHISEWAAVQRLGHRGLLDRLIQEGPSYYRRVNLKTLGGFSARDSFRDG